jgi:ABC-type lipoprotein release transport system permease subunit
MSSRFNLKTPKMFIRTRSNYEKLPGGDSQSTSPTRIGSWSKNYRSPAWASRLQRPRMSFARVVMLIVAALMLVSMLATGIYKKRHWRKDHQQRKGDDRKLYHWERYPR